MKGTNLKNSIRIWLFISLAVIINWVPEVRADRSNWEKQNVNWRLTGGKSIKAIYYPDAKPVPVRSSRNRLNNFLHKKTIIRQPIFALASTPESATLIFAYVIDSPPVDGFVPWIVVSVTNKRLDDLELDAVPETSVLGRYPRGVNPMTDYAIGIFDTGASAHVMGFADATKAGLFNGFPNLITSNTIIISGVIEMVDVWVSQPLAIFVDGLGALDPNGLLLDTSGMRGQSNVAISVGQNPGKGPDLPTIIGAPLSVYFTTVINNDEQVTINRNSEEFTGPNIRLYGHEDPCIPAYSNIVPLELRPGGAIGVQYIPSFEGFFEFPPASPSIIVGNSYQSLFFVHSVDLSNGQNSAIDKNRFFLDTGAQLTVIGSRIAARLRLNPSEPEFEVEVEDVTGTSTMAPGFYIDSIQIPAIGEWLSYTNVPVILLDVSSPEGGTVDGIIGMNLFVDFNLVLRGGGMLLDNEPELRFAPIMALVADIAPDSGDGKVNFKDLSAFAIAWLSDSHAPNWNARADMAPIINPDGTVDSQDFAILAQYWLTGSL
jgi:hypothetical protein